MGIIVFLVILSVIVFAHEGGHFLVAKALGIKVDAFSLGFKKIFGIKIGETEYRLGLMPLGGYVQTDQESFEKKSPFLRLLVILAGVTVNFLLAIVLVWYVFWTGFLSLQPTIGKVVENSPAYSSGLQTGDTIKKINDHTIRDWDEASKIIFQNPNEKLLFEIQRKDLTLSLYITPEKKLIQKNPIETEEGGVIGIMPSGEEVKVSYAFIESGAKSITYNYELLRLNTIGIFQMLRGKLSAKDNLAGPIGIAAVTNTIYESGWTNTILWTAALSLALAFMNILPIPVLDGGYIPFLLFEIIFCRKVNQKFEKATRYIGLILLLALFFFATFFDLLRIFVK